MGKEYKFFKDKNQRVRIFKLIFVCMHHLIKSMRKCLREAISMMVISFTICNFCFYTA